MSAKKGANALARVSDQKTLSTLKKALSHNYHGTVSRWSPNAEKLQDGAIQRASIEPKGMNILSSVNTDKIGFSRRPHHGVSSMVANFWSLDPWINTDKVTNRIARIYYH